MDGTTRDATATATRDRQLLDGCRSGDSDAWERLLDQYGRLVYSIAIREGLPAEDAADVTQGTFEALLRQLDRIHDDTSVASWLMTVVRRSAWRVRNDRRRISIAVDDVGGPGVDDPMAEHDRRLSINAALQQVGEPCRSILTALYFDPAGPSYAEVAARVRRPVGSIGPTRARCLERLRTILGDIDTW